MIVKSRVNPKITTHQIIRAAELTGKQDENLVDAGESLQLSRKEWALDYGNKPHIHIKTIREMPYAQEAWIVMEGAVLVWFYDIDEKLMFGERLEKGDVALTFRGGHSYKMLEKGTWVYEFKTGPYWGTDRDKRYVGEDAPEQKEEW